MDSTNDEARRLAESGAEDGTVVWALEQTAGKGRRGRQWVSPGGNLYCSLLLRPDDPPAKALQLSFVAANSLAETAAAVLPRGTHVTCKWPNDVLVEGRKVGGILLDSETAADGNLDWLVVGVGLNAASHPSEAEFPATSLAAEGAADAGVDGLLETFCSRFMAGLVAWRALGFAVVRRAWLQRAHGLGRPVTVRLENETLEGIFQALDADGAMVLSRNGRERRITAGDVFPAYSKDH